MARIRFSISNSAGSLDRELEELIPGVILQQQYFMHHRLPLLDLAQALLLDVDKKDKIPYVITDFPEAKKEIRKAMDAVLRAEVKQNAPMLSLVGGKTLHEGDSMGVVHEDGRHVVNPFQHAESQFSVSREEMLTMKPDDLMAKVSTAAKDMAGQMERHLFQTIDESVKESGNTVPGNPKLGPEAILTALEMVSVDFEDDERSRPVMPTIVTAPGAFKKMKENEARATEEEKRVFKEKQEAILDKKFQEHLADLESRKIVD